MVKKFLFILIIAFIASVVIIFNMVYNTSDGRTNPNNMRIKTEITNDSFIKGFLKVDENNFISQNCSAINSEKFSTIGQVNPPFKLLKKEKNDTLFVIKKVDTILFKMMDYSNDSIYDPTFGQLFRRLLKRLK